MPLIFKKLLLTFTAFWVLFFSVAPTFGAAHAAAATPAPGGTWYNSTFQDWYAKVYDDTNPSEIFGERYTAAQVQWVIYGLFGFLINTSTGPENASIVQCFLKSASNIQACTQMLQQLVTKTNEHNIAINAPTQPDNRNVWSLVFATDRSFSGLSYTKQKLANFSIVPTANAQSAGFGFDALSPIQGMWAAFRDIAFGLFVIVAMAFAFMIMFRLKLSPQTVISVQSALPKIIGSLILVTFSYAIAGFLVDLMYVVIGILSFAADTLFKSSVGISLGAAPFFNFLTLGQPFGTGLAGAAASAVGVPTQASIWGLMAIYFAIFFLPMIIFILLLGTPILLIPGAGAVIYVIFVIVVIAIALIIALWTGIKIVWSLLKAFVNILLLTIFAPVQIAMGAIIPALGFGQWMRSFVSNLAVFVVVGALFLFSFLFMIPGLVIGFKSVAGLAVALLTPLFGGIAISSVLSNFVASPSWPPLLGGGSDAAVGFMFFGVSFVLFTLTPKAAEIVQGLMSGKPFAYGSAIGEAFGGVGAAYGMSGAKDVADALMMKRKLNTIDKMFTKNVKTQAKAEQVVQVITGDSLDNSKSTLKGIIERRR